MMFTSALMMHRIGVISGAAVSVAHCTGQRLVVFKPVKDEGCFLVLAITFLGSHVTEHCFLVTEYHIMVSYYIFLN